MEDKMIMMDVLATEKQITTNTATAMHEASSELLYKLYSGFFEKLSKEVKEIFALSYAKNWYKLEESPDNKIEQEITKLCSALNKEE